MNRIFHPADGVDAPAQSTEIDRALLRLLSVPFFAMLTAIGAQIAVPIEPFGIPITLQTLMVLLAAMALGPKLGMASMVLYLVMGIVGVGVFAKGESGLLVLLGQTGGYLFGFIACQPIAHTLVKRRDGSIRGWLALFLAGIAVHLVIFVFGVPWLWWTHWADDAAETLSWGRAVYGGFTVFIPGILLKSGIAAGIGAWVLPWVARRLW
jgi:biotin transport system substrate-specific component